MKLLKTLGLAIIAMITINCNQKLPDKFHMEKRYWDPSDYQAALGQLKYGTSSEEGYPRLSDPFTAPVYNKLVDLNNVSVILEDETLGLKYRNEMSQKFFDYSQDIRKLYQKIDIQDKFIYPVELVGAIEFGLGTQLLYFKVGNDQIIKNAVNPNAKDIKRIINRNEQIIADNFKNDIEFLTKEDSFTDEALKQYAKIINKYFTRLINEFPGANYSKIKNTSTLILKKVKSKELKKSLENLIKIIDNKHSINQTN